jgi:hypothetical protein
MDFSYLYHHGYFFPYLNLQFVLCIRDLTWRYVFEIVPILDKRKDDSVSILPDTTDVNITDSTCGSVMASADQVPINFFSININIHWAKRLSDLM